MTLKIGAKDKSIREHLVRFSFKGCYQCGLSLPIDILIMEYGKIPKCPVCILGNYLSLEGSTQDNIPNIIKIKYNEWVQYLEGLTKN